MNDMLNQLSNIVVPDRMKELKKLIKTETNPRTLDKLVKEYKVLNNLQEEGLSPSEAFTRKIVPVIPSIYRAPIELPDGNIFSPHVNTLLRDVGIANSLVDKADSVSPEHSQKARKYLYKTVEQLAGFSSPKDGKNLFDTISGGKNPAKRGLFQRHLTRKRVNLTGRSVISPSPDIDIDEVELPYDMGLTIYEPFMKKELRKRGFNSSEIDKEIKNKTTLAKDVLRSISKDHPVLINRAPSIWSGSVTAHKPIFTNKKNIGMPSLSTAYQLSDYDGDAVSVHVPVSPEAIDDAWRMVPSKNVIVEETGKIKAFPDHSAAAGIYMLSKTPDGRKQINNILPEEHRISSPVDKGSIKKILTSIGKDNEPLSAKTAEKLRKLGDRHAYETGFTIGLSDIASIGNIKSSAISNAKKRLKAANPDDSKLIENIYHDVIKETEKDLLDNIKNRDDNISIMLGSKARGSLSQFRDMLISPLALSGENISSTPIEHSYSDGLTPSEYWKAAHGARQGVIGRAQETALPGALGKELLSTTNTIITKDTTSPNINSIPLPIDNIDDILDRVTAKNITSKDGSLLVSKDTVINADIIQKLKTNGIKNVHVYTPLGSSSNDGTIPAFAYGVTKNGVIPEDGSPIGAISALGLVEPLYSGSMKKFHTGAAIEGNEGGYTRLKQLLELTSSTTERKKLPNEATLSTVDGTVDSITTDDLNGHNIMINNTKHYVLPGNSVNVKVGSSVKKGDILSSGPAQPKDLSHLKSIIDAQNYMVDEIRNVIPDIRRRNAEVIVESITRFAKVIDPGDTDYLPGDIDLVNNIKNKNGDVENPATYDYIFRGVNTLPQASQSWLSKLNFRNLKRVFQQDVITGAKTDIHSAEPIPALAYSKEFGKGEKGYY